LFVKNLKKILPRGTAFGIQGFRTANEREQLRNKETQNSSQMVVAIFFLTMFLTFLVLVALTTIGEQKA